MVWYGLPRLGMVLATAYPHFLTNKTTQLYYIAGYGNVWQQSNLYGIIL